MQALARVLLPHLARRALPSLTISPHRVLPLARHSIVHRSYVIEPPVSPYPPPHSKDKVLHDFSDLPQNVQHIITVLFPSVSSDQRLSVLEKLSSMFPTHPAVAYHYGALLIQLMDYDGGLSIWDKIQGSKSTSFQDEYDFYTNFVEKSRKWVQQLEADEMAQTEGLVHKWAPIKPLADKMLTWKPTIDLLPIYSGWNIIKNKKSTLTKLCRLWSIETGKVELLYRIPVEVTKTLLNCGFMPGLFRHMDENSADRVIDLLEEQKNVIELIMGRLGANQLELNPEFLCELQSRFIKYDNIRMVISPSDKFQIKVPSVVRSGRYKFYPNSPHTRDGAGTIHQYCPPSRVSDEVDLMLSLYKEYVDKKVHPLLLSAWLHHRFTQIHPFMDGNGRVARAIASIPLLKANLPPLIVMFEDSSKYFAALLEADKTDNLEPLVTFFADSSVKAINVVLEDQKTTNVVQQ